MAGRPTFKKGDFNLVIGAVGNPACGKSRKLMEVLTEARKRLNCYILIHDPSWNLDARFYPDLVRHTDVTGLQNAVKTAPKDWHVSPYVDAEQTLDAAWAIADVALKNKAPVVMCYIDEMAMVAEAQHTGFHTGKTVKLMFTQRRHRNMGILWGCQSPAMLHYNIFHLSTHVFVFRLTSSQELTWLRKAGMTEECIRTVATLKPLEFILWKPGTGRVEEKDIFSVDKPGPVVDSEGSGDSVPPT
jgi:hypothetical protein